MYEVSNDVLKIKVNSAGAELESLEIKNINILWKRNELWNSQSPILFPIIGALKDNYYIYNNNKYELTAHGFIRDSEFQLEEITKNKITLGKEFDEKTLSVYPFKFKLIVEYKISNSKLDVIFSVLNLDDKQIPFSIGFHPGFSYSGLNSLLGNNIELNTISTKCSGVDFTPSLVKGFNKKSFNINNFTDMSKKLTVKRTLCYKGIDSLELIGDRNKLIIINDMSYTAFWQKNPEANPEFICIEGWEGIPDFEDTNHEIITKKGIVLLNRDEVYKIKYTLIFKEEK